MTVPNGNQASVLRQCERRVGSVRWRPLATDGWQVDHRLEVGGFTGVHVDTQTAAEQYDGAILDSGAVTQ